LLQMLLGSCQVSRMPTTPFSCVPADTQTLEQIRHASCMYSLARVAE
jgi:hypothetical protein